MQANRHYFNSNKMYGFMDLTAYSNFNCQQTIIESGRINRRYSEIKELTVCGPKVKYIFIYNIPHA
jgi:hypothetical protein